MPKLRVRRGRDGEMGNLRIGSLSGAKIRLQIVLREGMKSLWGCIIQDNWWTNKKVMLIKENSQPNGRFGPLIYAFGVFFPGSPSLHTCRFFASKIIKVVRLFWEAKKQSTLLKPLIRFCFSQNHSDAFCSSEVVMDMVGQPSRKRFKNVDLQVASCASCAWCFLQGQLWGNM